MEYELMRQSILKNLQELSDLITDLWNIRAKLYKKNKKLYEEIIKECE